MGQSTGEPPAKRQKGTLARLDRNSPPPPRNAGDEAGGDDDHATAEAWEARALTCANVKVAEAWSAMNKQAKALYIANKYLPLAAFNQLNVFRGLSKLPSKRAADFFETLSHDGMRLSINASPSARLVPIETWDDLIGSLRVKHMLDVHLHSDRSRANTMDTFTMEDLRLYADCKDVLLWYERASKLASRRKPYPGVGQPSVATLGSWQAKRLATMQPQSPFVTPPRPSGTTKLPPGVFATLKAKSLCLNFQRGACSIEESPHQCSRVQGGTVRHECAACGDSGHGFFACPSKSAH